MVRSDLVGAWGEEQAARYLRRKWYRIEAANYRCRLGEIDLIASTRRNIIFVEVKLRKNDAYAEAREYVTRRKQSRIRAAASLYLSQNPTNLQPRFDVIEIYAPEGIATKAPIINHLEDAFQ